MRKPYYNLSVSNSTSVNQQTLYKDKGSFAQKTTDDTTKVVSDQGIGGLVVEYVVAIHVTRVRFPADALLDAIERHDMRHASGNCKR